MSETITITIEDGQTRQKILHDKEKSILETFIKNGTAQGGFCKGLSLCGRCKIRFLKGAPFPGASDRQFFDAALLREGYRLACAARPKQDCTIELCFEKEADMQIIAGVQKGAAAARIKKHSRIFAAADIGTTTVVMQLADVLTGEVLSTVKFMNPQRCYGLDVLSRIQAAAGHGEDMKKSIWQAVMGGIKSLQSPQMLSEQVIQPELLCITGNTAMLHILMGYDTSGLGKSPFAPVSVEETEIVVEGIRTLIMPSVSAFVGADVAAGILETGMQHLEKITLLIDLGTNGEMALGNRDKIFACAAAAGPAFEGGTGQGIYGADILAAIACLLDEGIIEENGYMKNPGTCIYRGKQIEITLEKVREIQLAKAAVRAGIELLIKKYGISSYEQIDRVYLAGGFGFFLSDYAAVRTGLLPRELGDRTRAIGNSALAGALSYGRNYLIASSNGSAALNEPDYFSGSGTPYMHPQDLLDTTRIKSFNLAEEKEFQETYVAYMDFPQISG